MSASSGSSMLPSPNIIDYDPYLKPFESRIKQRLDSLNSWVERIEANEGGLEKFSRGYERFGLHWQKDKGVEYIEWAPGATAVHLVGDFNEWNRESHPCEKNEFGVWRCFIPNKPDGSCPIPHDSRVKVHIAGADGSRMDRVPAWASRAVQQPDFSYCGAFWNPPTPYVWKNARPPKVEEPRIYEVHIGMASEEARLASYAEFERDVLPRIRDMGYNAIQIMAIMEHAYYASFGYHVTNFFAASSRFGTPDELKSLIDTAHGMGITVFLDIVHSHASKNVLDGINKFDGTEHMYFHEGGRGHHDLWDSRLFNYSHWEVARFLLSNLRWWVEEYHFDGFRFDGVTSMLYLHHGMSKAFVSYDDYFGGEVDMEAVSYIMLANKMLHDLYPFITTIAEDVSGMPGLCRPVSEGGLGFDFRLGMAIPDHWIKLLKEFRDDDWVMGDIVHQLTNRRWKEKTISYAESHDQALVGDKTVAFWLMDKEMYWNMSCFQPSTPVIDRGMALHKMIRLVTYALGGEGYLTFMGNEFGHPEWIDFPRAGNNNSYHYARRRWDLPRDEHLRYKYLDGFERAMHELEAKEHWLSSEHTYVSWKHEHDKVIAFERGSLLWVLNFHPTQSYTDYRIGTLWPGVYEIALNSDDVKFGGHGRIEMDTLFFSKEEPWANRPHFIQAYIPCRTALVFRLKKD